MHVHDQSAAPLRLLRPTLDAPSGRRSPAKPGTATTPAAAAPKAAPAASLRAADPGLAASVRTELARAAGEPEGTLTVKALLEAWGRGDAEYDLNTDGTVDMADLVMLLAELARGGKPPVDLAPPADDEQEPAAITPTPLGRPGPPLPDDTAVSAGANNDVAIVPADEEGTETDPPPLTMRELLEAWGTSDPRSDLNADGTVDMADVVALLARLAAPPPDATDLAGNDPPTEGDDVTVTTNVRETATDIVGQDPVTIRDLLAAWGGDDRRYDLDVNGVVDMADLLELLTRMRERRQGGQPDRDAVAAAPGRPAVTDDAPRPGARGVDQMAAKLLARLRENGFETHPPTNIHQLVAHTRLAPTAQRELLAELAAGYPAGLGVNVLG